MNHERMITYYKRRKRQRLNHLGWVSLAITIMVVTITILILTK